MTLVSAIYDHGNFIMVSDRAISQEGVSTQILLPSTNEYISSSTQIVGFNVKTIIVQDILCVGFSGLVSAIEDLVSDIKDYFLHRDANRQTLKDFLQEFECPATCSVIYALGEPDDDHDQVFVLRFGTWSLDQSQENFSFLSTGSGANDWAKELLISRSYLDNDEISSKFCRQRALQNCINFLAKERITPKHLIDGWGGGFDLAYYEDGKFKRLENLAYAFYIIDISNPNTVLTPISIIHQRYSNGKVIIRHFEKHGFQNYIISEFNNKMPYIEEEPDCICHEVISCVHLFRGREHLTELAILFWDLNPNSEPTLYTSRKGDKFGIQFRKIYYDKLNEAVRNYLS